MDAFAELLQSFAFNGVNYTLPTAKQEDISAGQFVDFSRGAYKASVVVFACMDVRCKLFSEARFAFQRLRNGRPEALFSNDSLSILERPWENGTTGDLLYRMLQYADLAGNAFVVRRGSRLTVLRPDWVTIVSGSDVWDVSSEVLGYVYEPGGPGSGRDAVIYLPEEIAHFAPIPDPEAKWRGMSPLTSVVREVMADKAATDHKLSFFENGATVNLALKWPVEDLDKYRQWIDAFKREHEGRGNAYKTLHLGGGADATVVGADFQQMDFKVTQGAGETRIATAFGVPPVIVGLSEGLQGSSLNAGNYQSSRRRFADNTIRPLWRNAAASLEHLVNRNMAASQGVRLWYDDRDIPALRDDEKDVAEILQAKAAAMKTLIDAGYEPESVTAAVDADDLNLLDHTGLVTVQLQEPGTQEPAPNGGPASNGQAPVPAVTGG